MATIDATQNSEVTYITGVTSAGSVAPTSFWTWNNNQPATYGPTSDEGKWGSPTAGAGATITYAFNPASNWTATEESAFATTMSLWSAFANVTFTNVGSTASAEVVIGRASDGTAEGGIASLYPSSIGSAQLGSAVSGEINIDTSVAGFGPLGSSLSNFGGYPWLTLLHEEGHVLGLGHGGPYDEGMTTTTPQYTQYDTRAYTVMSYNDPTNVNWGVTQASNGRYYSGDPTTPMILDIAALQRLYGLPTSTPFSGGQTFGFNSNISGSVGMFYDFTINTQPVVTIWDGGTGNTLDLSGYASGSIINLNQGSFSSAGGLLNNIGIAYGAEIDKAVGGPAGDLIAANQDGDTILGGGGDDTIYGGASGFDALYGNAGNDVIHLQASGTIFGGQGDDRLFANDTGAHYISADIGNDTITSAGLAGDSLFGGQGNDVITAVDNATVYGGQGDDMISVSGGVASHHLISGDLGNDVINDTSAGGDTLAGGPGADTITATAGRSAGEGDIFLFHANDSTATASEANLDHITGFISSVDHLTVANHNALIASGAGQDAVFHDDAGAHAIFGTEAQAYQAAYAYAFGGSNFAAAMEYLEVHETYGGTNVTYVFGHDGFGVGLIGQASALATGDIEPGS